MPAATKSLNVAQMSVAFARMFSLGAFALVKYSYLRLTGSAPKSLPFTKGALIAFMSGLIENCPLSLTRVLLAKLTKADLAAVGLGTDAELAQWAIMIGNEECHDQDHQRWRAFWIPFQHRSLKKKSPPALEVSEENIDISKIRPGPEGRDNSDLIIFYVHGGGYIIGQALDRLVMLLSTVEAMSVTHKIKISILSMEYSLSPEVPYPGAFNECMAAYRSLILDFKVDPKRVIFYGESAGGNMVHAMTLKIRDDPSLGMLLPAATVSASPWMFTDPKDYVIAGPFDMLTPKSVQLMMDCYSGENPQRLVALMNDPYVSPLKAKTMRGLPPMLVFIGGSEILRESIEQFTTRAQQDGVDCQVLLKEERPHCWFTSEELSSKAERDEVAATLHSFLKKYSNIA